MYIEVRRGALSPQASVTCGRLGCAGVGAWDTSGVIRGGNATIYVTDMDRSVAFYTEVLGLRLAFRAGDHWATIDAGDGFQLGLHPATPHGPAPGTAGAITVGLGVDAPIERVVSTLTGRGVAFHGPVLDEGNLKLAFFTDPDGNEFYLAEQTAGREEKDQDPAS